MRNSIFCQLNGILDYVVTTAQQGRIPTDDLQTIEEKLHLMASAVAWERRRIVAPKFWEDMTDGGAA